MYQGLRLVLLRVFQFSAQLSYAVNLLFPLQHNHSQWKFASIIIFGGSSHFAPCGKQNSLNAINADSLVFAHDQAVGIYLRAIAILTPAPHVCALLFSLDGARA